MDFLLHQCTLVKKDIKVLCLVTANETIITTVRMVVINNMYFSSKIISGTFLLSFNIIGKTQVSNKVTCRPRAI